MTRHFLTLVAALAAGSMAISSASAAPITVLNHSFEAPGLSDGGVGAAATSWTTGGGVVGQFNPTAAEYTGATGSGTPSGGSGSQVVFASGGGFHSQTLTDTLQVGTYTLTVAVGNRSNFAMGNWVFDLRANGISTVLATSTGNSELLTSGAFTDKVLIFNVLAGNPNLGTALGIVLSSDASGAAEYDNVRLDFAPVAIPEPASMALLGLGSVLLLARRRKA